MRTAPPPGYRIRPAREADVALLPAVERSAARLIARSSSAPGDVGAAMPAEALDLCRAAGTLWVAVDAGDGPVGFAAAGDMDGMIHLHELSVAEPHQRRGLGAALVAAVVEDARWRFAPAVTLTTDRIDPWCKPFYARLGFVALDGARLSGALAQVLEAEAARGLDPERRCAMAKLL